MTNKIKPFFSLNKSDIRAYLVLILLAFFCIFTSFIINFCVTPNNKADFSALKSDFVAYQANINADKANYPFKNFNYNHSKQKNYAYSKFNPNKLSFETAMKMGFSKKLYNNLTNYIAAGGGFSKKSDLKKLYGMSPDLYDKLSPYIDLKDASIDVKNSKNTADNFASDNSDFSSTNKPNDFNNIRDYSNYNTDNEPTEPIDLYAFNPNEISKNELIAFGINDKAASNWEKFRAGGGKFFELSDVERIYSLEKEEITLLQPFIQFPQKPVEPVSTTLSSEGKELKEPYPFDPNEIEKSALVALGLEESVAARWVKFRKRNPYYSLNDIEKIYGLGKDDILRLAPFMLFPDAPTLTFEEQQALEAEAKAAEIEMLETPEDIPILDTSIPIIELNSATKAQLVLLPNIQAGRANLIIEYREKLGGFVRMEQLLDVWKVAPKDLQTWLPYLQIDTQNIQKININTATVEELLKHPEISRDIANSIVKIRKQNGEYKRLDDIKRSYLISTSLYEQLKYYFVLE